jgi:hypothetical protein
MCVKCLGHETLRGHVQCVYRITTVPISWSLVTQACLLENLHRLDTMIVEEVAKKGRHTITRLGARFVERRTSRAVGALVTPWSSGKVATPCSRVALVRVASHRSNAACQMESQICTRGYDGRHRGRQSGTCDCREHHEQPERHPHGQTCRCCRVQNQKGQHLHHCR